MIKVEKVNVWGFEHAIRGMRNPLNSWDKSDSNFDLNGVHFSIGENDLDLMRRLYKAGTEHRKYLRQIFVSMDITAPLYFWKEFDTYKFILPDPGHVDINSCSTMHKIAAKEFKLDDFSHDRVFEPDAEAWFMDTVNLLNQIRDLYMEAEGDKKKKRLWYTLIQLLPSSYNQRRTVTMNYENVVTIIKQRSGHKLDEWNDFIRVLKELPYIVEITGG